MGNMQIYGVFASRPVVCRHMLGLIRLGIEQKGISGGWPGGVFVYTHHIWNFWRVYVGAELGEGRWPPFLHPQTIHQSSGSIIHQPTSYKPATFLDRKSVV